MSFEKITKESDPVHYTTKHKGFKTANFSKYINITSICKSSYKYSFFNLPILVFYILHHLPVQAIHWNYFRPELLLPDVKTIHPVRRHASVSLLPEY